MFSIIFLSKCSWNYNVLIHNDFLEGMRLYILCHFPEIIALTHLPFPLYEGPDYIQTRRVLDRRFFGISPSPCRVPTFAYCRHGFFYLAVFEPDEKFARHTFTGRPNRRTSVATEVRVGQNRRTPVFFVIDPNNNVGGNISSAIVCTHSCNHTGGMIIITRARNFRFNSVLNKYD